MDAAQAGLVGACGSLGWALFGLRGVEKRESELGLRRQPALGPRAIGNRGERGMRLVQAAAQFAGGQSESGIFKFIDSWCKDLSTGGIQARGEKEGKKYVKPSTFKAEIINRQPQAKFGPQTQIISPGSG